MNDRISFTKCKVKNRPDEPTSDASAFITIVGASYVRATRTSDRLREPCQGRFTR